MSQTPASGTAVGSTDPAKFRDPAVTASGHRRAAVELVGLETLWFNTGTRCNIECRNCYVESSPSNDRLVYLSAGEVSRYLDEIAELGLETSEIGFTGGEPFLNRDFLAMAEESLSRGFQVLVLTNAMQPMMRQQQRQGLLRLRDIYNDRLHLRVSLDHYTRELHEVERGNGSWSSALAGLRWLAANRFRISVAGRTCWGEAEGAARRGYARLFAVEHFTLDARNPVDLVLFPEMDPTADVPEITDDCWGVLGVDPHTMMCARSRMVVKRWGATSPTVQTCTLLPYDPRFELGSTLRQARGPVRLNHPYCAQFCVLGGASCSLGHE